MTELAVAVLTTTPTSTSASTTLHHRDHQHHHHNHHRRRNASNGASGCGDGHRHEHQRADGPAAVGSGCPWWCCEGANYTYLTPTTTTQAASSSSPSKQGIHSHHHSLISPETDPTQQAGPLISPETVNTQPTDPPTPPQTKVQSLVSGRELRLGRQHKLDQQLWQHGHHQISPSGLHWQGVAALSDSRQKARARQEGEYPTAN